jgi:hypothetical protein
MRPRSADDRRERRRDERHHQRAHRDEGRDREEPADDDEAEGPFEPIANRQDRRAPVSAVRRGDERFEEADVDRGAGAPVLVKLGRPRAELFERWLGSLDNRTSSVAAARWKRSLGMSLGIRVA